MKRKIVIILSIVLMALLAALITGACVWQPPMIPPNDGLSAFEIWLEAGHEGTEEDFLEWLKGTAGQDGERGQDGKSAFEIWQAQDGNQAKTEADFLEWLRSSSTAVQNHTLSFAFTSIPSITAPQGTLIWQPSPPTDFSGIHFAGWFQDQAHQTPAVFPFILNQDTSLYPRWVYTNCDLLDVRVDQHGNNELWGFSNFGLYKNFWYRYQGISIVIPASITTIMPNAFALANINNLSFEAGSRLISIGSGAFIGTALLHDVRLTIPDSVISIGDFAFMQSSLRQITIPYSVIYMGTQVFSYWGIQLHLGGSFSQMIGIRRASNQIPDTWSATWSQNAAAMIIWEIIAI